MNTRIIITSILVFLLTAVSAFALRIGFFEDLKSKEKEDRLMISASFYPLAEFSHKIGKDKVTVINMTPVGSEPHNFDPSPKDLARLFQSKVFIYNGLGFEPWVERILPDLKKLDMVIVNSSQGVDQLSDPHIWLDPQMAVKQVDNITLGLVKADPANGVYYQKNASLLRAELRKLDNEYKERLSNCESKDVIVSHNAFFYLARRYNLNIIAISGLSPDEEPSPRQLARIVDIAKKKDVKYIFFESLVSPKLAQVIAKEIGAKTLILNPIEGLTEEDLLQRRDYIGLAKENLNNLTIALNCQ